MTWDWFSFAAGVVAGAVICGAFVSWIADVANGGARW